MENNDIYAISGRIKNIIARSDIALSPAGTILVNYFTLMFKDLYAFAEARDLKELDFLLKSKENIPQLIIEASTPKEDRFVTLYDEVCKKKAEFKSAKQALNYYKQEYNDLGAKHGMSGKDFWMEAESSEMLTEDQRKIMRLQKAIQMCYYLIQKEKE